MEKIRLKQIEDRNKHAMLEKELRKAVIHLEIATLDLKAAEIWRKATSSHFEQAMLGFVQDDDTAMDTTASL